VEGVFDGELVAFVLLDVLLDSGAGCNVCPRFDDGDALWASVCERRLEGVVAKRDRDPYRLGSRTRSFWGG
jgi:hypothetical protein